MSLRAECPACGKAFRVPHADRTWNCKACGGELELVEQETGPACPSCGEALAPEVSYCEACGHQVGESAKPEVSKAAYDRRRANADIRKARRRLNATRGWLALGLVSCVYPVVSLTLITLGVGQTDLVTALVVGIYSVVGCLLIVGLQQLERRPFFWSVAAASLITLERLANLGLSGAGAFVEANTLEQVLFVGIPLILWGSAVSAARIERLVKEHPDTYMARKSRGHGEVRPGIVSFKKSPFLNAVGVGLILSTLVVTYTHFSADLRAAAREERRVESDGKLVQRLDAFMESWNSGDVRAVASEFPPEKQDKLRGMLDRTVKRRKWTDGLPRIQAYDVPPSATDRRYAYFYSSAGEIRTTWTYESGAWTLGTIKLPK